MIVYLPSTEISTVNNDYLSLTGLFAINKYIYH